MKSYNAAMFIVLVLCGLLAAPPVFAVSHKQKFKQADQNQDGKIQPVEARKEKQFEQQQKSKVDQPWEAKADVNGDGRVEKAEVRRYTRQKMDVNNDGTITAEERSAWWIERKAKVNTAAEKRWDLDQNGVIEGDEARQMMQSRLVIIKTDGKAKVNTDIERAFDANQDGVIDSQEAGGLKEALEQK